MIKLNPGVQCVCGMPAGTRNDDVEAGVSLPYAAGTVKIGQKWPLEPPVPPPERVLLFVTFKLLTQTSKFLVSRCREKFSKDGKREFEN